VFDLASCVYSGYTKYRRRADHRVIRVFVLEMASPQVRPGPYPLPST